LAICSPEPEEEDLGLTGTSPAMLNLRTQIRRFAATNAPVLIVGETGVGKELVARAIHRLSRRSTGPFVPMNCGTLNPQLLESELFGHEKGAFTGADQRRKGKFESASGGILFLEEINSTTPDFQVTLLRVVQDKIVTPVGSDQSHAVDVRIIVASNQILDEEVKAGRFRQDLFYRLNVLTVRVPPLREREGDVVVLAEHFVNSFCVEENKKFSGLSDSARAMLVGHDWPGNVRELENVIHRSVVLAQTDGPTLPLEISLGYVGPTARSVASNGSISDLVFDALLSNTPPLEGMLKGDCKIGNVTELVLREIEAGLDKYLSSTAGQELLAKNIRKGVVLNSMGLSDRSSGNTSQFAAQLRQVVERAFDRHASS
jgi:DNA-binding NtrC family response regulator